MMLIDTRSIKSFLNGVLDWCLISMVTLLMLNLGIQESTAQTCHCDTLRDYRAMKTFAAAMTGHPWDTTTALNSWKGVTLNEQGCIESLDASSLLMKGVIPLFSIGNLECVKSIVLHSNKIFGPIPPDIEKLTLLERLDLAHNEFSTGIPIEISKLSSLNSLRLNGNFLSGTIPEELGELTNLGELFLGNNELNGPIPNSFKNLSRLFGLSLSHNQLSGPIPPFFQDFSLIAFQIDDNQFVDTAWVNFNFVTDPFFNLPVNLNISNNEFSYLPQLTFSLVNNDKFFIQGNRLTFDDIQKNLFLFKEDGSFDGLYTERYGPQKPFSEDTILTLSSSAGSIINLNIDQEIDNNTYRWYKDGQLILTGDRPFIDLNQIYNSSDQYEGVYTCEVENLNVAQLILQSGKITVKVPEDNNDSSKIPSVFTPNGDGINDYFILPNQLVDASTSNQLIIYNRSGETVFQQSNYTNQWDGLDQNQQRLPDGTYYFLFKSPTSHESGLVTILR